MFITVLAEGDIAHLQLMSHCFRQEDINASRPAEGQEVRAETTSSVLQCEANVMLFFTAQCGLLQTDK